MKLLKVVKRANAVGVKLFYIDNISDQLLKRKCITILWLVFLPSIAIYSMDF